MNNVLFSFSKEKVTSPSTTLPGKKQLFRKIRERGMQPVVSINGESAFDASTVQVHELIDNEQTRVFGTVALDEVGVIVNRLDRSFRHEERISDKTGALLPALPDAWINAKPVINENTMRSLVTRKARVQEEIFAPLELGMPTRVIKSVVDVATFIAENPSEQYVIKPNSGTASKGVRKVSEQEAIQAFIGEQPEKEMIIQPCYDFSRPFSSHIQPYDAMSNEAFAAWSKSNAVKELRMYAFHNPVDTVLFPVARAMQDGSDHWFFVDPESVPEKVFDNTRDTISHAARATGSRAVYAALDFGYGTADASHDPDWHIVELNARIPYLIGYDKHPEVADKLRDMYADQLHKTSRNQLQ